MNNKQTRLTNNWEKIQELHVNLSDTEKSLTFWIIF